MPEFVTGEMKFSNGKTMLNVIDESHGFVDFNGQAWSVMLRPGQSRQDPDNSCAVWLVQVVNHTTGIQQEFEATSKDKALALGILAIG